MIYRITHYIQPWEIDDLERQINNFILSSYYINDTVIFDITLNVSDIIIDWSTSKLPRQYFIEKFKYLETKLSYYFKTEFDIDENIQGCTDKRRSVCQKEQDYIIWLDFDIFLPSHALITLIEASKLIKDECFILTPEIIKYWDDSWDCITNEKYLNYPHNMRDDFDVYSLDSIVSNNNINIRKNNQIKFGGGWFNLFTNSIFEKIKIPDEIGPYGSDDTYIMLCSPKLNIPQYILEGLIVTEIGNKFLVNKDYIKPNLTIKIKNKNRIPDTEFNKIVQKFYQTP